MDGRRCCAADDGDGTGTAIHRALSFFAGGTTCYTAARLLSFIFPLLPIRHPSVPAKMNYYRTPQLISWPLFLGKLLFLRTHISTFTQPFIQTAASPRRRGPLIMHPKAKRIEFVLFI